MERNIDNNKSVEIDREVALQYKSKPSKYNVNLKGLPKQINGKEISNAEYDRIASFVEEQLYRMHKKSNFLKNFMLDVPASNDLIFVKESYYDAEDNIIYNSNLEYIKIE